jgi:hypothetical protein
MRRWNCAGIRSRVAALKGIFPVSFTLERSNADIARGEKFECLLPPR